MGISSLGAGSSILTQDVLDQLRAADEAKFLNPIDASLKEEKDKTAAYDVVDAYVDNVYESLKSLTEYGVFESRTATSSNTNAVEVSALESSDVQDFTLEVGQLATKEITQSGSYATRDASIATGTGAMELAVGDETFRFDYTADTTLEELKDMINRDAGNSVNATVVQVADGDFRLLLSAANTGTGREISITDVAGAGESLGEQLLADPNATDDPDNLVDGMTTVQSAVDAQFKFNGVDIVRTDNSVDDLLDGVTLTLKEASVGTVINVSVQQDRGHIEERITNFIDKYNEAMTQLKTDTKSSQEVEERGVFSSDSTIKGMKSSLTNMISTVGGGVGRLEDFGIDVDEDGRLSLDSDKLGSKLDEDPASTQAFFVGGTFTQADGTTIELDGAFAELEDELAKYSKYGNILDDYKEGLDRRTESLNDQRERAVQRLDSSYAIMAKRFAAYDSIINQYNNTSAMFAELTASNDNNN